MGYEHYSLFSGFTVPFPEVEKKFLQNHPGLGIHSPERFVHEQNISVHGESSGYGYTLLHTAGQIAGIFIPGRCQTDFG